MKHKILVTGGAGYIGSHSVKKLKKAGYEVKIIDDLSTGSKNLVDNTELFVGDISDAVFVKKIVEDFRPDAVIHFAASKDAAESVAKPDKYFQNNTAKSIIFFNTLVECGIKNIIFSSTAAVYGDVQEYPITEEFVVAPVNPYGISKHMIESVLLEYQKSLAVRPIILRYFNAGGASLDGSLGNLYPDPKDVVSVIMGVASGESGKFVINGTDYDTRDGSCIRDIIHVEDLADAHVAALDKMLNSGLTGIFNLGSQNGYSIKEIVDVAKRITGKAFAVESGPRRDGDIIVSIASSAKAKKWLGWEAKLGLEDILQSAWKWQQKGVSR